MKELENIKPDKPEMAVVIPVEKKKINKKLFPLPGHKYFELELNTSIIRQVFPEKSKIKIVPEIDIRTGEVTGTTTQKSGEIKRKENCLYCTALNAQNADKEFHRMRGLPYKKPKKQKK